MPIWTIKCHYAYFWSLELRLIGCVTRPAIWRSRGGTGVRLFNKLILGTTGTWSVAELLRDLNTPTTPRENARMESTFLQQVPNKLGNIRLRGCLLWQWWAGGGGVEEDMAGEEVSFDYSYSCKNNGWARERAGEMFFIRDGYVERKSKMSNELKNFKSALLGALPFPVGSGGCSALVLLLLWCCALTPSLSLFLSSSILSCVAKSLRGMCQVNLDVSHL